jgi:hypothetical protein
MPFIGEMNQRCESGRGNFRAITRVKRRLKSAKGFTGKSFGTVLASNTGRRVKAEIAFAQCLIVRSEKDVHDEQLLGGIGLRRQPGL